MSNEELKSYVDEVVRRQAERTASKNDSVKRKLRYDHSPIPKAKFRSPLASQIKKSAETVRNSGDQRFHSPYRVNKDLGVAAVLTKVSTEKVFSRP
jgi:hypothetical protein